LSHIKKNRLRRIFELYTSDLSYDEIERLIKQEASDVYEFFKKEIPKPDKSKSRFSRALILLKSLFNAFILKMSPSRRFFYFISLLFLVFGLLNETNGYIILSFIIINLLLAFELADKLLMKNEFEVAQKIQESLAPKNSPLINNFDISFHYEPAREVGGDYLDFISIPEKEKTFIFIGDISGKGIAAALYVVRVQAIIHQLVENFASLIEIIINLRKYFSRNLRKEFFLTLAAAEIRNDKSVSICRAGHNAALHYKKRIMDIDVIKPGGIAIGFNDAAVFEKSLEEYEIKLETGDILFFYTDGISETMNDSKILFGEERIKEIIKRNADRTAPEIKEQILYQINIFKGNAPIADDMAFILMKCIA